MGMQADGLAVEDQQKVSYMIYDSLFIIQSTHFSAFTYCSLEAATRAVDNN